MIDNDKMKAREQLLQGKNNFFAVIIIALLMTIALPPTTLNALLTIMIASSLVILLVSIFKKEMSEFSFYPSLLRIVTLARLSLNISLTTIILTGRGATVGIIAFLGSFTAGNNLVMGMVIFAILALILTVVVARGSNRVTEVTARFILDAMPIKAMAIDADLNSGEIDQNEATMRRENISRKARFLDAMVRATKFVKNDAIVSTIITIILFGGVAVGYFSGSEINSDALQAYILLTIGAGLVIHIPALIISLGAGVAVSRMATDTRG